MEIGLGIFLGIIFVVVAYIVTTRKKKVTIPPPIIRDPTDPPLAEREPPNDKS